MLKKIGKHIRFWIMIAAPVLAVPLFPNCPLSPFE